MEHHCRPNLRPNQKILGGVKVISEIHELYKEFFVIRKKLKSNLESCTMHISLMNHIYTCYHASCSAQQIHFSFLFLLSYWRETDVLFLWLLQKFLELWCIYALQSAILWFVFFPPLSLCLINHLVIFNNIILFYK